MLTIVIPRVELWDEVKQEFQTFPGASLLLEHSLIAISKWESKYHKSFLSKDKKTDAELRYYVKCMTITPNISDLAYRCLTPGNLKDIQAYMDSPMSATTFRENKNHPHSNERITSELIYYWMVSNQVPFECEKWHINRLMNLLKICGIKNQEANSKQKKPKKTASNSHLASMSALNAQRRAALGTKG